MKTYSMDEIKEFLRLHLLWLENKPEGSRANLYGANLYGANLKKHYFRKQSNFVFSIQQTYSLFLRRRKNPNWM